MKKIKSAVGVGVGGGAVSQGRSPLEGVPMQVALNSLFISPANVRKVRNAQSIPELAALIESEGLLLPLCVVAEVVKGKATGRYGVIAGGRRLEALHWLSANRSHALDRLVDCKVYEADRAVGVSLAENVGQESMHAADQLTAFKALVAQGQSAAQIAARFGVSVLTVERRLKLANLAPAFLDLYRTGGIKPDQLQALALTDDHARQLDVWATLSQYDRSAYRIRILLTDDELPSTDALVRFVGLDAYEAAGGPVRRDLFSESGEAYLQDPALVQKLADDKLEQACEAERLTGWQWVEVRSSFGYDEQAKFTRLHAKVMKPKPDEAKSLAEVAGWLKEVRSAMQALGGDDRDEDEFTDAESAQLVAYETQLEELEDLRSDLLAHLTRWSPAQLASAGAVVTMTHDGKLRVFQGLVHANEDNRKAGSRDAAPTAANKTRASFSEALMLSLTAHRSAAVSASLIGNPRVAMVALLHGLVMSAHRFNRSSPVGVSLTDFQPRVRELATGFADSKAAALLEAADGRWGADLPDDAEALFVYLMAQDAVILGELLAFYVARSLNLMHSREQDAVSGFQMDKAIEQALGLDMADWWEASPVHFLDSVPKAKVVEAVTEACGEAEAHDLLKMKKADAVAAAAAKLQGTRWLPSPLRCGATAAETVVSD